MFAALLNEWQRVKADLESGESPKYEGSQPVADFEKGISDLKDLSQRRHLASHISTLKAKQREAINRLGREIYDRQVPIDQLVDDYNGIVNRDLLMLPDQTGVPLGGQHLIASILDHAAERRRIHDETGRPAMGLSTGLMDLDDITGGFEPGQVTALAANTGVGKTTLAVQMAEAAVYRKNAAVVYVTFENSAQNLALKLICRRGKLNTQDVQQGTVDLTKLGVAAGKWAEPSKYMEFIEGNSRLSVHEIEDRARDLMSRRGVKQCLVVIDYLQLFAKSCSSVSGLSSSRERVESVFSALRLMANSLKSPVLVLSAINREGSQDATNKDKDGGNMIHRLKESGDLEFGADVVLLLKNQGLTEKNHDKLERRRVALTVGKNRNGPSGATINLVYAPERNLVQLESDYYVEASENERAA